MRDPAWGTVLLGVLLGVLGGLAPTPMAAADARSGVASSVVKVETTYQESDWLQPWNMLGQDQRTGSGCVIEGGRILTNAHVVSDATFLQVRRAGRAQKVPARVEVVSHELDLAILRVDDPAFLRDVRPLPLGGLPAVGETVIALGFPVGGTRITITEGVVSRIDRGSYSHSHLSNLVCQIDAAINPGSSGGPVVSPAGELLGVAFEVGSGDDVGYMVPAPVIRHLLADLEDGRHDGVPGFTLIWQTLENPHLRQAHRVPGDQTGVLVTRVAPLFAGEDGFLPGDVLLSLDGFDIANDGTIAVREDERIGLAHAVDRRQIGDRIPVGILRDGERRTIDLRLEIAKREYGYLVPRMHYEVRPTYYVAGGLVFSPLTSNYLSMYGEWADVPHRLKHYYYEQRRKENRDREDVVVLIDVLPHPINVSYAPFEDAVVQAVNGRPIGSLRELIEAIEAESGPWHRISLEHLDSELVLPRAGLREQSEAILQTYRVPADRSENLRAPAAPKPAR